jgi:hypothetical protein
MKLDKRYGFITIIVPGKLKMIEVKSSDILPFKFTGFPDEPRNLTTECSEGTSPSALT